MSLLKHYDIVLDRNRFLEKKCAKLERENHELKNALTLQTIKSEKSYKDLEPYFTRLSKQILTTIIHLVKVRKRAVHHDEIITAFKKKHSFTVKSETITRQTRHLADPRYCKEHFNIDHALLHSPSRGKFITVEVKKEVVL